MWRNHNRPLLVALFVVLGFGTAAIAGSLTPAGVVGSTMHSLAEVYDSIAGTFDSSAVVANQNGNILQSLKYIEANMGPARPASNSLDFDEFVDAMNLDANTSIASHGFTFTVAGQTLIGPGEAVLDNSAGIQGWTGSGQLFVTEKTKSTPAISVETENNGGSTLGVYAVAQGASPYGIEGDTIVTSTGGSGRSLAAFASAIGPITASDITGLHVFSNYVGGGAQVTDSYGIRVADQTVGINNFALRTGLGKVVFGDNVGIGTTTPQNKLEVAGNVVVDQSAAPVQIASLSDGHDTNAIDIEGTTAYILDRTSALIRIYDISRPASPSQIASIACVNNSQSGLETSGGILYAPGCTGSGNLTIYDVSNPKSPVLLSQLAGNAGSGPFYTNVHVRGHFLYVPGHFTGFRIFDVANPRNPVLIATLSTGGNSIGADVSGRYLYIVNFNTSQLVTYDVADPYNPVLKSTAVTSSSPSVSSPQGVYVYGGHAFVQGTGGVKIYDLSNAASPSAVALFPTDAFGVEARVAGKYLYAPTRKSLYVADISTISSPVFVASVSTGIDTGGTLPKFRISGKYGYMTSGHGFKVFDLNGVQVQGISGGSLSFLTGDVANLLNVGQLSVSRGLNIRSGFSAYQSSSIFASSSSGPVLKLTQGLLTGGNILETWASASNVFYIQASTSGNVNLTLQSPSAFGTDGKFTLRSAGASDRLDILNGGGTNLVSVASTGNVGIGTINPGYALEIGTPGDINLASSGAAYRIEGSKVLWVKSVSSNSDTMVGVGAGANLTSGLANTFIGYLTGNTATSSSNNTFIGNNAGQLNRTGSSNLFVGRQAGVNNTYGSSNVFLGGFNAGANNTTGSNNVFIGQIAGQSNTTGQNNTFVGAQAGQVSTTGFDNVAIGLLAGQVVGNGNQNTYIGTHAGRNATGNLNTFIGGLTGLGFSTGGANTMLGYGADTTAATASGSVAIGYLAKVTASHQLVFGSGTASGSLTDAYFGQGVASVSPEGITLNATGGSGADNPGASLRFAGGKATGSALGGSILFQTSDAGGSGSTLQTLTTKMTLTAAGNVGIGAASPTTKFQVVGNASVSGNFEISGLASASSLQVNQAPIATGSFVGTLATFYAPVVKISKTYTTLPTIQASPFIVQGIWNPTSGTAGMAAGSFYTQIAAGNALNPGGTMKGINVLTEVLGTGSAIPQTVGGYFSADARNTGGTIMQANGTVSTVALHGAKTITFANPVYASGNISNSGVATNFLNVFAAYPATSTGGTIQSYAGLVADDGSAATNNIGLFISSTSFVGTSNLPLGNFAIYNSSIRDNYIGGNVGLGTKNLDAKFEINANALTTASVASISGTSLAGGSIFNITVPASTSANNAHGLMLVTDTNGLIIASWSMAGSLALHGGIYSHGAQAGCISTNNPTTGCIDYAESFPTTDTTLRAGDIVAVDPSDSAHVKKADGTTTALGIVSTNPAALITGSSILTGTATSLGHAGTVPVALAGRVPVKISAPVHAGDHLALSTVPGSAVTATVPGLTIGIALEDSSGPTVLTFVNTSYWAPDAYQAAAGALDPTTTGATFGNRNWSFDYFFSLIVDAFQRLLSITFQKGKVQADELCAGTTCVNQEQLMRLIEAAGGSVPTPLVTASPTATPASSSEPFVTVTPTPAVASVSVDILALPSPTPISPPASSSSQ